MAKSFRDAELHGIADRVTEELAPWLGDNVELFNSAAFESVKAIGMAMDDAEEAMRGIAKAWFEEPYDQTVKRPATCEEKAAPEPKTKADKKALQLEILSIERRFTELKAYIWEPQNITKKITNVQMNIERLQKELEELKSRSVLIRETSQQARTEYSKLKARREVIASLLQED